MVRGIEEAVVWQGFERRLERKQRVRAKQWQRRCGQTVWRPRLRVLGQERVCEWRRVGKGQVEHERGTVW